MAGVGKLVDAADCSRSSSSSLSDEERSLGLRERSRALSARWWALVSASLVGVVLGLVGGVGVVDLLRVAACRVRAEELMSGRVESLRLT